MAKRVKTLECFGGPLCGSKVPDTDELWFVIQRVTNPSEQHYYKRVKMIDFAEGKSLLAWHYHGIDPDRPGLPLIKPHPRKFK